MEGGLTRLTPIPGMVPDLDSIPGGCPFYDRCHERMDVCTRAFPETLAYGEQHFCACYFVEKERG